MSDRPAEPERALLKDLRAIFRGSERAFVVLGGLILGFLAFSYVGAVALDASQRSPPVEYAYLSGPDAVWYLAPEALTIVAVCVGVFLVRASGDRLSDLSVRMALESGPQSAEARATSFLDRSARWSTELGRIEILTIAGAVLLSIVFVVVIWNVPFLPPLTGNWNVPLVYLELLGLPLGVASYALIEVIDAWRAGTAWSRRLASVRRAVGAGRLGPTVEVTDGREEEATPPVSVFERSDSELRAATRRFRIAVASSAAALIGVTLGAVLISEVISAVDGPYFAPTIGWQFGNLILGDVALGVGLLVLAGLYLRGRAPNARDTRSRGPPDPPSNASESLARFARASDELLRLRQLDRLTAAALGWSLAWLVVWSVVSAPGLFRPYLEAGSWLTALAFLAILVLGALLFRWVQAASGIRRLERALSQVASGLGRVEHEFWERY